MDNSVLYFSTSAPTTGPSNAILQDAQNAINQTIPTPLNGYAYCDPYCDCHRRCSKCGKFKSPSYPYYPHWQYPNYTWIGGASGGISSSSGTGHQQTYNFQALS